MIAGTSIEGTARRLTKLFPNVDRPDGFLQWRARLLSVDSGHVTHVFVPHGVETSTPKLWQAVLEPSLAQLSTQVMVSEWLSQIESLKNEQQGLESEIKEAKVSEWLSQIESLKSEQQGLESEIKEAEARCRRQETLIRRQQQRQFGSSSGSPMSLYGSSSPDSPPSYLLSSTRHTSRRSRPSSPSTSTLNPFRFSGTSTLNPFCPDSPSATKSSSGRAPTPPFDGDDSIFYAMRLQHEFDTEDRALDVPVPRSRPTKVTRRLFVCGICLEEMPNDSIARPDPCGHTICRECLRGYVAARLNERRFPILCPTCTADKGKGKGAVGGTCCGLMVNLLIIMFPLEISQSFALSLGKSLGLTTVQFSIWTEMEMAAFSVPINCRKYVNTVHRPRSSGNVGIGASRRCSWPEMNTKRLTSSSVRFRTATMHGANSVSSRSTLVVPSTRAMALRN